MWTNSRPLNWVARLVYWLYQFVHVCTWFLTWVSYELISEKSSKCCTKRNFHMQHLGYPFASSLYHTQKFKRHTNPKFQAKPLGGTPLSACGQCMTWRDVGCFFQTSRFPMFLKMFVENTCRFASRIWKVFEPGAWGHRCRNMVETGPGGITNGIANGNMFMQMQPLRKNI